MENSVNCHGKVMTFYYRDSVGHVYRMLWDSLEAEILCLEVMALSSYNIEASQ